MREGWALCEGVCVCEICVRGHEKEGCVYEGMCFNVHARAYV